MAAAPASESSFEPWAAESPARGAMRVMALVEAVSMSGTAKAVLEFAREASRPRHDLPPVGISIVTFARGEPDNAFIRIVRREGYPIDIVTESGPFDPGVLPRLREAVKRRQPDILWTNAVKSHFLVRLSGLDRRAAWVAFHHGYTTTDWKTRLYNQFDRWSPRGARRVVTVCRAFAADLRTRGIRSERIRVQPMPIRPSAPVPPEAVADLRRQLGIDAAQPVLLAVGRLSREKGHAELLGALAEMRRREPGLALKLLIAGDGPQRRELETLSARLDLGDAVLFLGYQENVRPLYALADVFVLASHSEGSPNVLLEAMEAGVAVVATAVGGIPEIATDEENALLVEPRNVPALAQALLRAIQDPPLRATLTGAAGQVVRRHTPDQYYRNLVAIFREALSA